MSEMDPLLPAYRTDTRANLSKRTIWFNNLQTQLNFYAFMWQLFLLPFYGTGIPFSIFDSLQKKSDPNKLFSVLTTSDDETCTRPLYTSDQAIIMFIHCLRNLGKIGQKVIDKIDFSIPSESEVTFVQTPVSELMQVIVLSLLKLKQRKRLMFLSYLNEHFLQLTPAKNKLEKLVIDTFTSLAHNGHLDQDKKYGCLVQAFRYIHATTEDLTVFNEFLCKHGLEPIQPVEPYPAVTADSATQARQSGRLQRTGSASNSDCLSSSNSPYPHHRTQPSRNVCTKHKKRTACITFAVVSAIVFIVLAAFVFIPGSGSVIFKSYEAKVYGIPNTNIILDTVKSLWYHSVDITQTSAVANPFVNQTFYLPSKVYFVPSDRVRKYDSPPVPLNREGTTDDQTANVIEHSSYLFSKNSFEYSLCLDPLNFTLYSATLVLFTDEDEFEGYLDVIERGDNYTCKKPICQDWPFDVSMTEPTCHSLSYSAPQNNYYFITTTIRSNSEGISYNGTVIIHGQFLNESDYSTEEMCNIESGDDSCVKILSRGFLIQTEVYEILAFIGRDDISDPPVFFNLSVERSHHWLAYSAIFFCSCIVLLVLVVLVCLFSVTWLYKYWKRRR